MIRSIARWRIRNTIDQGRDLPRWVARRLDWDIELRKYATSYSSLERLLPDQGDRWAEHVANEVYTRAAASPSTQLKSSTRQNAPNTIGNRVRWGLAVGFVAVLISGYVAFSVLRAKQVIRPANELAEHVTPNPNTMGADTHDSSRLAEATARSTIKVLKTIRNLPEKFQVGIHGRENGIGISSFRPVIHDMESTKDFVKGWDGSFKQEGRLLISDLRSSTEYFSTTLPHRIWKHYAGLAMADSK